MAFNSLLTILTVFIFHNVIDCELDVSRAPTIQLPRGELFGGVRHIKGTHGVVFEYLGIPYAQAPVGELRFKPPQPHSGWQGLLDATKSEKVCYQDINHPFFTNSNYTKESMSEDCLTINVYTSSIQGSRPVLVFIHGGGLIMGMNSFCDGAALVAYEDIVVVAMNYRLGAFGFLTTGDSELPANLGLRDQQEALRWVQKNIGFFGGDPNQVTVSGESAGGWSVNFHMLSPGSTGLFHRAMPFSGTVSFPNITLNNPKPLAIKLAKSIGCSTVNSREMVDCLMSQPAETINEAMIKWPHTEKLIGMTRDEDSLPGDPMVLLQNGSYNRVPLLNFLCSQEGALLVMFMHSDIWFGNNLTYPVLKEMIRGLLGRYHGDIPDEAVEEVLEFYITKGSQRDKPEYLLKRYTEILGEYLFDGPITQLSRFNQEYAKTYMGVFTYRPSYVPYPTWVAGATHGDEQASVWGFPFLDHVTFVIFPISEYSVTDEKVALLTMKYVGNFVKTGNPNGDELPNWPEYTMDDEYYLDIRAHPMAGSGFRKHAVAFWLKLATRLSRGWRTKLTRDEL